MPGPDFKTMLKAQISDLQEENKRLRQQIIDLEVQIDENEADIYDMKENLKEVLEDERIEREGR